MHPRASSGCPTVIIEESAEPLLTMNAADTLERECAFDQLVRKALMIPLTVIMLDVLGDRPAEVTFAERDHPIEALVLDRAHEPFGIRIRIRRLKRRLHDADPGLAQ